MLVSAISQNVNVGYNSNNSMSYYSSQNNEAVGDTVFNSLAPFAKKANAKVVSVEKLPQVFENINEWKNFCHKQILGEKLNVIA